MGNEQGNYSNGYAGGTQGTGPPRPILRRHSQSPADEQPPQRRSVGFRDQTEDALRRSHYQQRSASSMMSPTGVAAKAATPPTEESAAGSGVSPRRRKSRAPPPPPAPPPPQQTNSLTPRLPKMDQQTQEAIRSRARDMSSSRPASVIDQRMVEQRRKFDMTNFKVELAEAAARHRERQIVMSNGGSADTGAGKDANGAWADAVRTRPVTSMAIIPRASATPGTAPTQPKLFDPSRQELPQPVPASQTAQRLQTQSSPPSPRAPPAHQPQWPAQQSQPSPPSPPPLKPKPKPQTVELKEELKQEILKELLESVASNSAAAKSPRPPTPETPTEGERLSRAERQRMIEEIRREVLLSTQARPAATSAHLQYEEAAATAAYYPYHRLPPMMGMPRAASEYDVYNYDQQPQYQPYPLHPMHQVPPPPPYQAPGGYQYGQPHHYPPYHPAPPPQHPAVMMRRYGFTSSSSPRPYASQWEPIYAYTEAPRPQPPPPRQSDEANLDRMQREYDERYMRPQQQRNTGSGGGGGGSQKRRLSDSWRRMTSSLSKAFGGGGSARHRSAFRNSTFEEPAAASPASATADYTTAGDAEDFDYTSRTGSLYDLSGAEMPQNNGGYGGGGGGIGADSSGKRSSRKLSRQRSGNGAADADIWRHVARASHDGLYTSNPAYFVNSVDADDAGQQRRRFVETTAEESVAEERRTVVTLQQRTRRTEAAETTAASGRSGGGAAAYRIPRAAAGLGPILVDQTRL